MIHRARAALVRAAALATRRPRAVPWTLLPLACALFVAGLAAIAAATVDGWADAHPGSGGSMVIYLGDGVDPARASELVAALRAQGGVERVELIPAEESARRLTRALGSDPALLDGVDLASLPASVEVALAPGVRDVVAMSPTVRALRAAPGVADVVVDDERDDRIAAVLHTARGFAWPAAGLFAGLALVIAIAAVRVRLDRPAREAAVLHLLGAPPGFVAIPSAIAGALQGVAAAVIAALALGLVLRGAAGWGAAEPGSLGPIALGASPVVALAGLVAAGALAGLVGGGLAGVARAR